MDESAAIASTGNLRVASLRALQPPSCVFEDLPGDMSVYGLVVDTRQAVANMLVGADDRLLVVVGLKRGSTDEEAFKLLCETLNSLAADVRSELLIVVSADTTMNADPMGDGSFHINRGFSQAREQVLQLNRLGLPTALEFRDTITPQFFADLLSWASVPAENEALQELVSGLSMPVGVRAPASEPAAAMKAIETSCGPHHFLGVSAEGVCGVVKTTGNPEVIAVVGASANGGTVLTEAVSAVHRQRPTASIMAEFGPDGLEEAVGHFCNDLVGASGSLGSKVIGAHLRVTSANATARSLSGYLTKLATAVTERRRSRVLRRPGSSQAGTETDNLRIVDCRPLLPPACLLEELPRTASHAQTVLDARGAISAILNGSSDRVLLLAGPAVIDDLSAAVEYGARLAALARDVSDDVLIVMTSELVTPTSPSNGPWAGPLFDPNKDGSYVINVGIRKCRELLLQLAALGLPTALEFRETITPQFFADLLAFAQVNAQSETLAQLVSGLSMPAGLYAKQRGGGADDLDQATSAHADAATARHFLGVTAHGLAGIVESTGNADCAMVLGGGEGAGATRAAAILEACTAAQPVIANCGNGGAIDSEQMGLVKAISKAISASQPAPKGVAVSSYMLSGAQVVRSEATTIRGLSVTEPCMDWGSTEQVVQELAAAVRARRAAAASANGHTLKRPRAA